MLGTVTRSEAYRPSSTAYSPPLPVLEQAQAEINRGFDYAIEPTSILEYPTPTLRGDARALWNSEAQEVVISGPSECSKTWTSLHLLNSRAWAHDGFQGAIVRKVRADMDGTVLQTFRRILAQVGKPVQAYGGQSPDWYDYPNGSRIYVGGIDKPGKVLSSERDCIYFNQAEEATLDDWETLTTRVTGRGSVAPFTQIIGDCNPGPSTHWILAREGLQLLHARHEDNPTLYTDDGQITEQGKRTLAVLDSLTGTRYQRLRLGRWVGAEGMVYEDWDRSVHLIDPFEIPAGWPRYRVIDFGFTNPFVCQWWAADGDGRLYLYREFYQSQRLVEDWAAGIKAASEGETYQYTIADHDAEGRETLNTRGVSTDLANKDVSDGIQKVQVRLRAAGDGKPRLYLFRDCLAHSPDPLLVDKHRPTCTADEFDGYIWAKPARTTDGEKTKEEPRKQDDHGMDALRYLCNELDQAYGLGVY